MRISSIAPFAVSAALSRACVRWRRASTNRAQRFGYANDAAGRRTAISRSGEAFGDISGATDASPRRRIQSSAPASSAATDDEVLE